MYINKNKFTNWYKKNLEKVILLFITLVTFTLTVVYIPYLNVVFSSAVGFLIAFITWYLLFNPRTYVLVILAIAGLGIALIATLLELNFLAEAIGEFLYLILVLSIVNFIKDSFKHTYIE